MSGADERGGFEAVLDQRLRVLAAIENMDKPSIATLYGYCLGGGLELPSPATSGWLRAMEHASGCPSSISARCRHGAERPGSPVAWVGTRRST